MYAVRYAVIVGLIDDLTLNEKGRTMNTNLSSKQQHLSDAPAGATLIAWHTSLDVASYRCADGIERLMICGELVPAALPTQVVVDLCRLPRRAARERLGDLLGREIDTTYTVTTNDVDGSTSRKFKSLKGARARFESMSGRTIESAIEETHWQAAERGETLPTAEQVKALRVVSNFGCVVTLRKVSA
jgi:hypothetical protein